MKITNSKFRNDFNVRYLKQLFFEQTGADKSTVMYTLKDHDHEGYKSLYLLYMEECDHTEYFFANKYLEGWEHWQMLCNCTWFAPYVERWRYELELKTKAEALTQIKQIANDPDHKGTLSANRILLEGGWKEKKSGHSRGRPSKEEVKKQASILATEKSRIDEDAERILQ